jgi:predicted TIM-barrel fold metal-dependent hydrolase
MIDIHTHPVQIAELYAEDANLDRAVTDVFGLYMKPQPIETYFAQLDEAGIGRAVLLPLDCTSAHGCRVVSNQQVAWLMEQSSRFIGFASVDPNDAAAAKTLDRDVREYGLKGLKLDPALQRFDLGDRERAFPVYAACVDLGIPLLVHCGLSWAPRGLARLANPLDLEAAVQEFPTLRFIIAHFGWPWVGEALMLALKHENVYLDTSIIYSGTPTESLRHVLADTVGLNVLDQGLRGRVLFGSNYPRVDPKRVVNAVRQLRLEPRLEERILHDNAATLLKVEESQ